jgi:hypothetical protein
MDLRAVEEFTKQLTQFKKVKAKIIKPIKKLKLGVKIEIKDLNDVEQIKEIIAREIDGKRGACRGLKKLLSDFKEGPRDQVSWREFEEIVARYRGEQLYGNWRKRYNCVKVVNRKFKVTQRKGDPNPLISSIPMRDMRQNQSQLTGLEFECVGIAAQSKINSQPQSEPNPQQDTDSIHRVSNDSLRPHQSDEGNQRLLAEDEVELLARPVVDQELGHQPPRTSKIGRGSSSEEEQYKPSCSDHENSQREEEDGVEVEIIKEDTTLSQQEREQEQAQKVELIQTMRVGPQTDGKNQKLRTIAKCQNQSGLGL